MPERIQQPPGATPHPLFAEGYATLRTLAHRARATWASETLGTTALVHEAFLKVARRGMATWSDRTHFLAVIGRAMRQILIDGARRARALKRGGRQEVVPFEDALHLPGTESADVVAVREALDQLGRVDPRRAAVVHAHVFEGHPLPEVARQVGRSIATVERDWRVARAWLATEMARGSSRAEPS